MELHLSEEERSLLEHILEERYLELRREIFHTDHHDFKRVLKQREQTLETLLNKLMAPELVSQ